MMPYLENAQPRVVAIMIIGIVSLVLLSEFTYLL